MTPPSDQPTIRLASEADLAFIAELRRIWTGELTDEPDFERRLAEWFAVEADRRTAWLAFERNRAVGMVTLAEYRRMPRPGQPDARWGYVAHLFVREHARNRGIGAALLDTLISCADRRGYVRLVLSPSGRAVPFFRRAGFSVADETSDALLLVRGGRDE
jgi:GNAT superfamily N-acetyltransferase